VLSRKQKVIFLHDFCFGIFAALRNNIDAAFLAAELGDEDLYLPPVTLMHEE
jgi:hypothetical protein